MMTLHSRNTPNTATVARALPKQRGRMADATNPWRGAVLRADLEAEVERGAILDWAVVERESWWFVYRRIEAVPDRRVLQFRARATFPESAA